MKVKFKKVHHLTGHQSSIFALCAYKEPHYFVSGDGGGYAVLWNLEDVNKGIVLASTGSNIFALHFFVDLNVLLIGTMNGHIYFVDVEQKKVLAELQPGCKAVFDFCKVGDLIYAGTESGTLLLIDVAKQAVINQYKMSEKSLRSIEYYASQHHLIIGSSDHHIYRFDLNQEKVISTLSHHRNSVFTVCCLDDTTILSGSRDAHLNIWQNDELYKSLPAHNYTLNHIAVSPNRKLFATAGKDKSIKIFDASTFDLIKVIDSGKTAMHTNSVNKLLWTSYHNYLISVSDDRIVMVWVIDELTS